MTSFCARVSNVGHGGGEFLLELTTDNQTFAYVQVQKSEELKWLEIGDAIMVNASDGSQFKRIQRLPNDSEIPPIKLPFDAQFETVSYSGTIFDCYDPVFGIYNWDNQALLFTCGMLLNLEVFKNYTFENLHCVNLNDVQGGVEWLKSVIGSPFPTAFGVIFVYCPVYSSLEGFYQQPKPTLCCNADFASLLSSYFFLKRNESIPKGLIDFSFLEKFASAALSPNFKVSFREHCCRCQFTQLVTDYSASLNCKYFIGPKQVKDLMLDMRSALKAKIVYNNTSNFKTRYMNHEILQGRLRFKSKNAFEFFDPCSGTSVSLIDPNGFISYTFNDQVDCADVIIFKAHVIVEMIPRLQYANTWSTRAYIWLSNLAKVICHHQQQQSRPTAQPDCISSSEFKLLRRYLQIYNSGGAICEAQFIEVQNTQSGQRLTKALKEQDKFYGLVTGNAENDPFYEPILIIKDAALSSPEPLGSDSLKVILKSGIKVPFDEFGRPKPVSVHLEDLHILSGFTGISHFSVKVRVYSIKEALFALKCARCDIQIKGGECLMHKASFVPLLQVKVALSVGDDRDGRCSILVENFDQLCKIMNWKSETFQKQLEKFLSDSGELRFASNEISLVTAPTTFLQKAIQSSPYKSQLLKLTFPFKTLKSVLKPVQIEICDAKAEILNLISILTH